MRVCRLLVKCFFVRMTGSSVLSSPSRSNYSACHTWSVRRGQSSGSSQALGHANAEHVEAGENNALELLTVRQRFPR